MDIPFNNIVTESLTVDEVIQVYGTLPTSQDESQLYMHIVYDIGSATVDSRTASPLVTFHPGIIPAYNIDSWLPPRSILNEAPPIGRALIISVLQRLEERLTEYFNETFSPAALGLRKSIDQTLGSRKLLSSDEFAAVFVPQIIDLAHSIEAISFLKNIKIACKITENIIALKTLSVTLEEYKNSCVEGVRFSNLGIGINNRAIESVLYKAMSKYLDDHPLNLLVTTKSGEKNNNKFRFSF